MKNFLFLAIAFFAVQMVSAQTSERFVNDNSYSPSSVDVKPEFPGGIEKFYQFIWENYKISNSKELLARKIFVNFVIEKDGKLTNVKVLRDLGFNTGKEAVRVLMMSPKWIPAELNGEKVRCSYTLPIEIKP
jgi:protein TonB